MKTVADFAASDSHGNGFDANAVKLSASWQHEPLAERSRSRKNRFDSAQPTA